MSRYAVSRKSLFSASCSIGYPRCIRNPWSPSMKVIFEDIAAVLRKAGSKTRMPLAVSFVSMLSLLMAGVVLSALKAVAGMLLLVMGTTIVLPVRLSVIVTDSFGGALSCAAGALCAEILSALRREGRREKTYVFRIAILKAAVVTKIELWTLDLARYLCDLRMNGKAWIACRP